MSSIYVLRHGQSVGNANTLLYSTMINQDMPLSKQGEQEAANAAKEIAKHTTAVAIFTSHYLRAIQTADIIGKAIGNREVKQNVFLAERQFGEQEGASNVDNFNNRPLEKYAYGKASHLTYRPIRGESFLDVQMRVAIFILQQDSFRFVPSVVLVSHRDACLALHSYFTGEVPNTESKWENCEIRKYTATPRAPIEFIYNWRVRHGKQTDVTG